MQSRSTSPGTLVALQLSRVEASCYHYTISYARDVLIEDGGFLSLATALAAAAQDGEEFVGFQVSYRGVVAGTYTPGELIAGSEAIAALCIERGAAFGSS